MPTGFQQQDPMQGFSFPKACAEPQHGRKADKRCKPLQQKRSFEPKPAR